MELCLLKVPKLEEDSNGKDLKGLKEFMEMDWP
jgi:hypothetical protein